MSFFHYGMAAFITNLHSIERKVERHQIEWLPILWMFFQCWSTHLVPALSTGVISIPNQQNLSMIHSDPVAVILLQSVQGSMYYYATTYHCRYHHGVRRINDTLRYRTITTVGYEQIYCEEQLFARPILFVRGHRDEGDDTRFNKRVFSDTFLPGSLLCMRLSIGWDVGDDRGQQGENK